MLSSFYVIESIFFKWYLQNGLELMNEKRIDIFLFLDMTFPAFDFSFFSNIVTLLIVFIYLIFDSIQSNIVYNLIIVSFCHFSYSYSSFQSYSYSIPLSNYCFSSASLIFFANFWKALK